MNEICDKYSKKYRTMPNYDFYRGNKYAYKFQITKNNMKPIKKKEKN